MAKKKDDISFTDLSELSNDMWLTLEHLLKTLKKMPGKLTGGEIRKAMWKSIERYTTALMSMEDDFVCGRFYKWGTAEKYLIFRLEAFAFNDADNYGKPLKLTIRPLTCTEEGKYEYKDLKNEMSISFDDFSYSTIEVIEIKNEDLPLYMGNKFNGSLFREMLSVDEANTGLVEQLLKKEQEKKEDEE